MATSVEPEDDTKASPDEESKGGANLEFKIKANLPLQGSIGIKSEKEELAEIKGEVDLEFPNLPEANRRNIAERRLQERRAKRSTKATNQSNARNQKSDPKPPAQKLPQQNAGSEPSDQMLPRKNVEPRAKQKPPTSGGGAPESEPPQTPEPQAPSKQNPAAKNAAKSQLKSAGGKATGQAAKSIIRTVVVAIGEFIVATAPIWGTIVLGLAIAIIVLIALCKVPFAQTLLSLDYCKALNITELNVGGTENNGQASPGGSNILALAQAKIGVRENPDDANSGPDINQFFFPGGQFGDPWCAYFASWVYGQAGVTEVGNLQGRGGTFNLMGYFATRQTFLSFNDVFSGQATPQPGDMAFFARGTAGTEGHVGIVKSYDTATKRLTTVDGNVTNSVAERTRDLDELDQCEGDDENRICQFLGLGRLR